MSTEKLQRKTLFNAEVPQERLQRRTILNAEVLQDRVQRKTILKAEAPRQTIRNEEVTARDIREILIASAQDQDEEEGAVPAELSFKSRAVVHSELRKTLNSTHIVGQAADIRKHRNELKYLNIFALSKESPFFLEVDDDDQFSPDREDEMFADMRSIIIEGYREQCEPTRPIENIRRVRNQYLTILRLRQLAVCLRAETIAYSMELEEIEAPLTKDRKTMHERTERLNKFWDKFRATQMRLEFPLGSSLDRMSSAPLKTAGKFWKVAEIDVEKQREAELAASHKPRHPRGAPQIGADLRLCVQSAFKPPLLSHTDNTSSKADAPSKASVSAMWNTRGARNSHCQGSRWNFSKHLERMPVPPSSTSTCRKSRLPTPNRPDWRPPEQKSTLGKNTAVKSNRLPAGEQPVCKSGRVKTPILMTQLPEIDECEACTSGEADSWKTLGRKTLSLPSLPEGQRVQTPESPVPILKPATPATPSILRGAGRAYSPGTAGSGWGSKTLGEAWASQSLPSLGMKGSTPISTLRSSRGVLLPFLPGQADDDLRMPPLKNPFDDCSNKDNRKSVHVARTTATQYARLCRRLSVLPRPFPLITGHSNKFDADSVDLVDSELRAVASVLRSCGKIEEVNLKGNTLLTEISLVPFLEKLFRPPACSLKCLFLQRCAALSQAVPLFVELLSSPDGLQRLEVLDIGGISIPIKHQAALCRAVAGHQALRTLGLAEIDLASTYGGQGCVKDLLSCETLRDLDLAWNTFGAELFSCLGEELVKTQRLERLSLAHCSSSTNVHDEKPIVFFFEHLAHDRKLRSLDISMNRIAFRSAVILEDALDIHSSLQDLDLSGNPLGALGMRSIVRLFSNSTCGVTHFKCDGCFKPVDRIEMHQAHIKSIAYPAGKYALNLVKPYDRACLRLLYKICDRLQVQPTILFKEVSYSLGTYKHPDNKNADGRWAIPDRGLLSFVFITTRANENFQWNDPDVNVRQLIDDHCSSLRLNICFRKVIPLLALWNRMENHLEEQRSILDALSKDFVMGYAELSQLLRSQFISKEVLCRLIPCLEGAETHRYLCLLQAPTIKEHRLNREALRHFLHFDAENPSGHYLLRLERAGDFAAAERLLVLNRWETSLCTTRGDADVSQHGDFGHTRNEEYEHVPQNLLQWCLQEHGELEFDYVSSRRPPVDTEPVTSQVFDALLSTVQHRTELEEVELMHVLQRISSYLYLSCAQLRELLVLFRDGEAKRDVVVTLFTRLVDIHNEKIFRLRFDGADMLVLRRRLGFLTFFPWMQPEGVPVRLNLQTNMLIRLDLSKSDERTLVSAIAQLAHKEERSKAEQLSLVTQSGHNPIDGFGNLPRAYLDPTRVPKDGHFTMSYVCGADDRNFQMRLHFLQRYSKWTKTLEEPDVSWWMHLSEAPADVRRFLEFLYAKFHSMEIAWEAIQENNVGQDEMTIFRFVTAIQSYKCPKLKGKDEEQRIRQIFRFLDSDGRGTISKLEWNTLQQIMDELTLSSNEFARFLQRKYGHHSETTFRALDKDGNGSLDLQEWLDVCKECGFYGNVTQIFNQLTSESGGEVTQDKFNRFMNTLKRRRALCTGELQGLDQRRRTGAVGIMMVQFMAAGMNRHRRKLKWQGSTPGSKAL